MIKNKRNKYISLSVLIVSVVIFFTALNLLNFFLFENVMFDVTPDKKYTLTSKTKKFLKNNENPLVIKFFVNKDLDKNKQLSGYALYLKKMFEEYKRKGKGLIDFVMVETIPFENSQAEAEKSGIENFYNSDEYVYMGASFVNRYGKVVSIPKFLPENVNYVERNITRKLSNSANETEYVVGIMSPFSDDKNNLITPLIKKIKDIGYNVKKIHDPLSVIEDDIDVLLVNYPINANLATVYAVDQFLMRGGNVIMFLDAYAEEYYKNKNYLSSYYSGFEKFLEKYGVKYENSRVVGNDDNFKEIKLGINKLTDPFSMSLKINNDKKHDILFGVEELHLNRSGYFNYDNDNKRDSYTATVLFDAGDNAKDIDTETLHFLTYENLLQQYEKTSKEYPLAILFEGRFNSLYDNMPFMTKSILERLPFFLVTSIEDGKLLLVADSDMITEELLSERVKSSNGKVYVSDNMAFLTNALDYMVGSNYVNTNLKTRTLLKDSLFSFFGDISKKMYEERQKNLYENLLSTKKMLKDFKYKIENKMQLSLKDIKQNEGLMKEELETEYELQRISYEIKEKREMFYNVFAMSMIFGMVVASVLLVFLLYKKLDAVMKK